MNKLNSDFFRVLTDFKNKESVESPNVGSHVYVEQDLI